MRNAFVIAVIVAASRPAAGQMPPCGDPVPAYAQGRPGALVCPADAPGLGLTIVDLSDEFVPRVLEPDSGETSEAAATYRTLAAEDWANAPAYAAEDRFLELFGVFPTLRVLGDRLADDERHACHVGVDDASLAGFAGTLARDDRTPKAGRGDRARRDAVRALQEHLVCDGLLAADAVDQRFGRATERALEAYRRRHMVAAAGGADAEVRALLLADSRELDFRALLRALRERVVQATGLLEDGSARGEWGTVLGRTIDSASLRDRAGRSPLPGGAPDLVSPAVDAAARALGWTDPVTARAALAEMRRRAARRVALPLPAAPGYHGPAMELRAEIDRGDVWYDYPYDAAGRRRAQPKELRPTLTLFARDGAREVALVRWPTTIGTWQREKLPGGGMVTRYKSSHPGNYVWRDIIAAPAWFAPPSTPDRELISRTAAGWAVRENTIGPGYRSAYGLVLVLHRSASGGDTGVRTHGTASYLSIAEGNASHGCHRLFTYQALRLADFLLAHRRFATRGEVRDSYARTVRAAGKRLLIRRDSRGHARDLDPPIAVRVLEGRIRGRARQPIERFFP